MFLQPYTDYTCNNVMCNPPAGITARLCFHIDVTMTYTIVFHFKAVSNMKCLLPFLGTMFSYLLHITNATLHGVSVSQHRLWPIFLSLSLPEEKLNLDQSDWEDIHVVTGALKLFFRELPEPLVPFGFFTDIVETVSE